MKTKGDNLKRLTMYFLGLVLLFASYTPAFAEEYDLFTQMIVDQVRVDMAKQGYDEGEYTIEVSESGEINVVIEQSSTATPVSKATPAPVPEKTESDYAKAYAKGLSLEVSGEWIKAIDAFVESEGYRDAVERILPYLEDYVYEMLDAEEYQKAQAALLICNVPELDNLLAECNDYCFTLDLAKGLNARWARSTTTDTSLMSDRKYKEFIRSLINEEMFYIGKYANMAFTDKTLAQYAYGYLGALQSQLVGIDYYGDDDIAYTEYYTTYGYDVRAHMIYWINRKYGVETDPVYSSTLKTFVGYGQYLDQVQAIERSITEQLRNVELNLMAEDYGRVKEINNFTIQNTSGYSVNRIELGYRTLDGQGNVVDERIQTFYGSDLSIGTEITPYVSLSTNKPFESIELTYLFDVYNNGWAGTYGYETFRGSVAPRQQWKFDGKQLTTNGMNYAQSKKPVFAMEDTVSEWRVNSSSRKELYVPVVNFTLRNISIIDAEEVVVKCVFVDKDTKVEWDETRTYVASSSTAPIKANYAREVTIYSSKGYTKRTSNVPNLIAEIYVNDIPMETIEIQPKI